MPPSAVEDLQVAVSEACANVVRHAYPGEISDESEILFRCSTDGGKITAEVTDQGCGFDGRTGRSDPDKEGGFGLILIYRLMDQVRFWSSPESGTTIRMVKFVAG